MADKKYYVYQYKSPRSGSIRYIGKGCRARWKAHYNNSSNKTLGTWITNLKAQGMEPVVEMVAQGLDERTAYALEIELIAKYGRLDLGTGTLFNNTNGGEGSLGSIQTEETRQKKSLASKRKWQNPEIRQKMVEAITLNARDKEKRARASENLKITIQERGGKEWARRMRDVLATPEGRAKQAENLKKALATPEYKARRAEITRARWQDPEYKARVSAAIRAGRAATREKKSKNGGN